VAGRKPGHFILGFYRQERKDNTHEFIFGLNGFLSSYNSSSGVLGVLGG
jgi:hypothetical protein